MRHSSFEQEVLRMIAAGKVRLSTISEPTRQKLIDLAMQDVPLVDIEGDYLTLTRAGLERLTP